MPFWIGQRWKASEIEDHAKLENLAMTRVFRAA